MLHPETPHAGQGWTQPKTTVAPPLPWSPCPTLVGPTLPVLPGAIAIGAQFMNEVQDPGVCS